MGRVWAVLYGLLLVGGILWCKEVFGRWREDLDELKRPDNIVRKGTVIFFWGLTAAILYLIVRFAWSFGAQIIRLLS